MADEDYARLRAVGCKKCEAPVPERPLGKPGRSHQYCSIECRPTHYVPKGKFKKNKCLKCGAPAFAKYCSRKCLWNSKREKKPLGDLSCVECGGVFSQKTSTNTTFCSKACKGRFHYKNRLASGKQKKYLERYRKGYIGQAKKGRCKQCGDATKSARTPYCSEWCKHVVARRSSARLVRCLRCEVSHTAFVGSSIAKYCHECRDEAYRENKEKYKKENIELVKKLRTLTRKKRRAKGKDARKPRERAKMHGTEYDSTITWLEIAEMYDWRCAICRKRTPRKLRGTFEDRAPEIDHIVPSSKGGGYVRSNLQLTCRKCNASKRDTQLTLL